MMVFSMATAGWIGWIALLVVIVAVLLIYFLVIRKTPKDIADLKADLQARDQALEDAAKLFTEEQEKRKAAEKAKTELEFTLLEQQHKEKLDALEGQEKKDLEKAKDDPQGGIDFINNLLGLGDSTSKPDKST
jgi:predicted Holliday junction resolvase-like endonuclease